METTASKGIFLFHPDTMDQVRKAYNLDKPGQIDAAVDLLDDWIKKQAHFKKKEYSREYIERTIILDKGSVERAKTQLDKLFTMKTVAPQYFEKTNPRDKDYQTMHEIYADALLPKLTKDHYRIYAGKVLKDGVTTSMLMNGYRFGTLYLDYARANDYSAGYIGLLDYRDINVLEFITKINVLELQQFITLIMESYQTRIKGIHILTSSKTIEVLVRILKQAFSKKVGERMFVHATEESLHQYVPKELLPQEFGGELKSLTEFNNDWVEEFSKKENAAYFEDMSQAQVDENLRIGKSSINNDLLGISGSFRTLCVD